MKTVRTRRRWRLRFGLKSMLVAMTLVAALMGTLGIRLHRARQQRTAVDALAAAGTGVWYEPKYMHRHGPNIIGWSPQTFTERWEEWAARWFGKDFSYQVHSIHFFAPPTAGVLKYVQQMAYLQELHVDVGARLTPEAWQALLGCDQVVTLGLERDRDHARPLAGISTLAQLRNLKIDGGELTIDDVREICELPHLVGLDLHFVDTNDEALGPLAKLRGLESFELMHRGLGKNVTDQGIAFVANLPKLRSLKIARLPPITDRVFSYCESIRDLESLDLDQASVRGSELHRLAKLSKLKDLNLIGTNVDDDALRQLAAFTQLETLDVHGTHVTDKGIRHLANLRKLRELCVAYTEVSDGGKAWLQTQLPACKIR